MNVEENISAKLLWEKYLVSNHETVENSDKKYDAWSFGNDEKSANDLVKLVIEKKKKSTSSLHCLYELENEDLPVENDYSIILDGNGEAQCVIMTTSINIIPFNEVTEDFAKTEGEDDMTLEYWRMVHKEFFTKELKEFNKVFTEDMIVVCEAFEVVYPM